MIRRLHILHLGSRTNGRQTFAHSTFREWRLRTTTLHEIRSNVSFSLLTLCSLARNTVVKDASVFVVIGKSVPAYVLCCHCIRRQLILEPCTSSLRNVNRQLQVLYHQYQSYTAMIWNHICRKYKHFTSITHLLCCRDWLLWPQKFWAEWQVSTRERSVCSRIECRLPKYPELKFLNQRLASYFVILYTFH